MRIILIFLAFFICYVGKTQTMQGRILDSSGAAIQGAVVVLSDTTKKNIIAFGMSDSQGRFILNVVFNSTDSGDVMLAIRHVGYHDKKIYVQPGERTLNDIILSPSLKLLDEIVIQSDLPIQFKGDTTTFDVQKIRTEEDKRLKDIFAKMPGFLVDQSGRLTFKGKMVDKLFIDGDDPAGFNYGLITQNLSPEGIDKIDVVENFSDDRLMKNVKSSDVVGVNIRMKSDYQMRLIGNTEIGLSAGKKRAGHISANLIGKKIKSLNFISANNAGQGLAENYSGRVYRSTEELLSESMESEDDVQMLRTINVGIPNIDERLTLHNNDLGIASLMSWRLGKFTKMNGQLGFTRTNQWIQKDERSRTQLPGVNSWETFEHDMRQTDENRFFSTFSFKKDKGKISTSKGHLMLNGSIQKQSHLSRISGDVKDSMSDGISGKQWLYDAKWSKTVLLGNKVVRMALQSEMKDGKQVFNTYTKRLLNFFKLDPGFLDYVQKSSKWVNTNSAEIRINQKVKNFSLEYGWRTKYLKNISGIEQTATSHSSGLKRLNDSDLNAGLLTTSLIGHLQLEGSKKWGLELSGNLGVGELTRNKVRTSLPDFSTNVMVQRNISRKVGITIGYLWSRSFMDWAHFVPDNILTGNATIQKTISYSGPSNQHSVNAALSSYNLIKQRNFVVLIDYTQNRFLYNSSSYSFPEYSINGFERFRNNPELKVMISQDIYVRLLKSTIQLGLNWLDQKGGMLLNGKYAEQRSKIGGLSWNWKTGFDFPVNAEFGGQLNYTKYNWNGEGPGYNLQRSWKSKIRWKINKNGFMAGRWKWYQLAPKKGFSSADFYLFWNVRKSIELKMEAVNLLNASAVETRRVNAYSESVSSVVLNKRFFLLSVVYHF